MDRVDPKGGQILICGEPAHAPRNNMRRSAVRNAIRVGVNRDTVKKLSGHLTDHVFSAYNVQALNDMSIAAEKIEQGAAYIRATATKTQLREKRPPSRAGCSNENAGLSFSCRIF
jgi:hypothetical protein